MIASTETLPANGAGQSSIRSSRLGRSAALIGTGAKVGINYLKYYGRKSITGEDRRSELDDTNARDVYDTFSQLKGGPLKVAQMLSIDQNLLPPAYSSQFAQAQYSAPPLSYPLVVRTFQREFGKPPLEIFDAFSQTAAHGASIGQVHKASLDGKELAVKVQYPGVADSLKSDLAMVKPFALHIMGVREEDVAEYFNEVEERLLEETDYGLELERSLKLSRESACLDGVRFPNYYVRLSTRRILTMDWIDGLTLDRFVETNPSRDLRDRIGQALWDFYHHQIHELRLFHADPHPGNFLVRDGELWVIDFGCTKKLDDSFYFRNFRLLDPALLDSPDALEEALLGLGVLLESDTAAERRSFLEVCIPSIRLLAKPFQQGEFDFGDAGFMKAIYEMGESNRSDPRLKSLRGARGSRHSVYVNRAYFGLYSLLARLGSRIRARLPEWLGGEFVAA